MVRRVVFFIFACLVWAVSGHGFYDAQISYFDYRARGKGGSAVFCVYEATDTLNLGYIACGPGPSFDSALLKAENEFQLVCVSLWENSNCSDPLIRIRVQPAIYNKLWEQEIVLDAQEKPSDCFKMVNITVVDSIIVSKPIAEGDTVIISSLANGCFLSVVQGDYLEVQASFKIVK